MIQEADQAHAFVLLPQKLNLLQHVFGRAPPHPGTPVGVHLGQPIVYAVSTFLRAAARAGDLDLTGSPHVFAIAEQVTLGKRQRVQVLDQLGQLGAVESTLVARPHAQHHLPDGRVLDPLQVGDQRGIRFTDGGRLHARQAETGSRVDRGVAPARDHRDELVLLHILQRTPGNIHAHG